MRERRLRVDEPSGKAPGEHREDVGRSLALFRHPRQSWGMTDLEDEQPLAMGVHLASGKAYFGLIRCPKEPLLDDELGRMTLAEHLGGGEQLADFVGRFRQEIRRVKPSIVGILLPNRHAQWVYRDAQLRASLEACSLLAAQAEAIPAELVRHVDAARAVESSPQQIPARAAAVLAVAKKPTYWNQRALAFATACFVAGKVCP